MVKERKGQECCPGKEEYLVEAIVTIDDRGQMVLPKSVREAMNIKPGDKLALITKKRDGKVCCLNLFKANDLSGPAKDIIVEAERS